MNADRIDIETLFIEGNTNSLEERLTRAELAGLLQTLSGTTFSNIEDFSQYLRTSTKDFSPPGNGIFDRPATTLRFFDDPANENVLADIRQKNEAEGMGNFTIPGTSIELINFTQCPECGVLYSFKELGDYYMNPTADSSFGSKATQRRRDSRVICKECQNAFYGALVLTDGLPQSECRFLCRHQTIEYIEIFHLQVHDMSVLSRRPQNRVSVDGFWRIQNDVRISRLADEPALVVNFLQYMDSQLAINFVFEKNLSAGDLVPDTIIVP